MTSQRRSVADTELAAVIAALYPERSFQAVHRKLAEDALERGHSANTARMLSSPEHTPLRVRVRPGDPEPEDALDGEVRARLLAPHGACSRGWASPAQTRGGVRVPAETRGAITGSSSSKDGNPSGVCGAQANGRLRGLATEGGHCVC